MPALDHSRGERRRRLKCAFLDFNANKQPNGEQDGRERQFYADARAHFATSTFGIQ